MAFKGIDYYMLDDLLTEEEKLIRDTVREFVEKEYLPHVNRYWEEGIFPTEIIPRLGELGLLGPTLPSKYGGAEIGYVAYGLIMQELERGDSGLRSFASVQSALAMYSIYTFGSEEQRMRWLPKMTKGELVGCFGLTEPDAGSDPSSMQTKARKDGGHWILNGTKMWITNGSIADVAVVWAKDDEGEIQGFVVERGTPGFSASEVKGKLSLRASFTSELVLEDVRISDENRLPNGRGLKAALMPLTQARYGIAWGAVGAAMACFEEALNYSKERIQFQKPIASFQIIQERLADMLTELTKAQLVAYHLGRLAEKGKMRYTHVALAKRNNVRTALNIARMARSILGANGITLEYQSMRHAMNLESVETYEGTYEIQTLILGRDLTGIDAIAR
jgi:glutaryl-CoA dehydrogenase